jgi:hypothetical protein
MMIPDGTQRVILYVIRRGEVSLPIVEESILQGTQRVSLRNYGNTPVVWTVPKGDLKIQSGFRSGGRNAAVKSVADASTKNTWADTLRVIQGLDYEYNSRPDRIASVVNPRTYEVFGCNVSASPWTVRSKVRDPWGDYSWRSGITGLLTSSGSVRNFSFLKDDVANAKSIASAMQRDSVPTAPAVNLTRFFGEQRDLPRMGKISNYFPGSLKDSAGGYLNAVFGVRPTQKDLEKVAQVVIDSHPVISEFLAHERRKVRRSRTRQLGLWNDETTFSFTGDQARQSFTWRRGANQDVLASVEARCFPYAEGYVGTSQVWTPPYALNVRSIVRSEVRSFATYEYFIPRPVDFPSRVENYSAQAAAVLGGGLNAPTAWELTPWSWLVDWFIDIGGLLRYQEQVATNSVVATRSGFVHEATQDVYTSFVPALGTASSLFEYFGLPTGASASGKYQKRGSGGPYDILKGWELSGSQSAIVTALAVSRYSPL